MPSANLSGANLTCARIQADDLTGAVVENATIGNTTFQGAWSHATFRDCELVYAYFGNSSLQSATFETTEDTRFDRRVLLAS